MKQGWPTKLLSEVCRIRPPKSEAREKVSACSLVSFLPMEDLGAGVKFVRATQTKQLSAVVGSYTYFADGDVLLAKITPCFENGKLGIAHGLKNGIGFGSSEYFVFRPDTTISKEWLYYFLSRETFRVEGAARMSGAVGHKRVSKEFVEDYPIPVPPLSEQHRIVEILDKAFADIAKAKANAEQNLRNARELFESQLNEVFTKKGEGWEEKRLGQMARISYGYTESASSDRIGPHFLRITDIQNSRVDWSTVPYCRIKSTDLPKYELADRDIVFARTGATTGKSFLISSPPLAVFASYLIRVQLITDSLIPEFLYLFFQSGTYWNEIRTGLAGSTQGGFNATKLGELVIPYPSTIEQQQIVTAHLDSLSAETQRLAGIYERKLEELEALKKSILHKAFSGEL